MEENKNGNYLNEKIAEGEEPAENLTDKTKEQKKHHPKKIRNQAFLKKGGYSVAITAVVLAGIIVFNLLLNVLSKRVNLEFDMTAEKKSTVSAENADYLKNLDKPVTLIFCANREEYAAGYMDYYAKNLYGVSSDSSEYYKQTVKLVQKYPNYNKKIKLKFTDPQETEFAEITTKYPNEKIAYGDIIVISDNGGNERHKVVGFSDIYSLSEDQTYAAYGYSMTNISGNNLETAVTSAIAYVTDAKTKKAAVYTGHSSSHNTEGLTNLLKANNYQVDEISDKIINSISEEYDCIVIAAPSVDFIESEINAISSFLDNGEKLGKGLLFFADATAPYLPNFNDFLNEWGISAGEGILFETDNNNHLPGDPTTIGFYLSGKDDGGLTDGMNYCISGYNAPITSVFETEGKKTVTSLMVTPETTVAAPVGTGAGWNGAGDYAKKSYSGVIQSKLSDYDSENNEISSYLFAFSSMDFIDSQYAELADISNKDIVLKSAERASGVENTGISFITKTITNESFAGSVTAGKAAAIRTVFMFLLPLAIAAAGIYVYFKRRNAE